MLDNLNKADERSSRLGELDNRADVLLEKVNRREEFRQAIRVEKRYLFTVTQNPFQSITGYSRESLD